MNKDLEKENKLLLMQLQQAREELEFYCREYDTLKSGQNTPLNASGEPAPAGGDAIGSPSLLGRVVRSKERHSLNAISANTVHNSPEYQAMLKKQSALKQENDVLKQENDVLKQENDVLKQENDVLKQENDVLKQENDVLKQENDALKQENDALKNQQVRMTAELNEAEERADHLEVVFEDYKQESQSKLARYEKERSLSLKILAKHQADLDDLREKYHRKKEKEQLLVGLVSELRDKLEAASQFYFKLKTSHPELILEDQA